MELKNYTATVHFNSITIEVWDCPSREMAKKQAIEMAEDLAACLRSIEPRISVDAVEVEEA